MKGCLIVFEGTEGSGKTVVSRELQKWLETNGYKTLWTKEPTDSRIGALIEGVLERKVKVAEEALSLLFAADRADHTRRIIIPAMKRGYIVLCDRYVYSSLAYQRGGMSKAFQREWLEKINQYSLKPDLVFFLDIDPGEGLRRIQRGQRIQDDRFFEDLKSQRQIRDAYFDILNLNKPLAGFFKREILHSSLLSRLKTLSAIDSVTVVAIDASLPQNAVEEVVREVIRRFLKFRAIRKAKRGSAPNEFLSVLSRSDLFKRESQPIETRPQARD